MIRKSMCSAPPMGTTVHWDLLQPANHHRVMRYSLVDGCFFICLRMKRTEEELIDMKDQGLQCRG